MIEPMEYFFNRVEVLPNGCWQWLRSLADNGYGHYAFDNIREKAHRFAFKVFVGEIPDYLQLDHLCRNRGCVNPEHLEAVSSKENVRRSPIQVTTINARKTHCIRGHEFTAENTRLERNGTKRTCKTCKRLHKHVWKTEYGQRYRAKKRQLGALVARIEKRIV